MTIITPTGVTGINSITSLVNDITFSTASGSGANASVNNLQASSVRLNGSTSGYTDINAEAVAGINTVTLPTGTGAVPLIKLETAKASTSGTSVDFTGIPSWVKKITVMFQGVSTNGSSNYLVQLGDSGGIENTGYISLGNDVNSSSGTGGSTSTAGFLVRASSSSDAVSGHMTISLLGSNQWVSSHIARLSSTNSGFGGGNKTLSDTLTQLRITTVNGTDTFDAGSINILYEG